MGKKNNVGWGFYYGTDAHPKNIMEIVKNNKLTKYYNNIQQIYCGVTGAAPPTLTRKEEEKIIEMFQEVEGSYRKYMNRYNFLFIHMY